MNLLISCVTVCFATVTVFVCFMFELTTVRSFNSVTAVPIKVSLTSTWKYHWKCGFMLFLSLCTHRETCLQTSVGVMSHWNEWTQVPLFHVHRFSEHLISEYVVYSNYPSVSVACCRMKSSVHVFWYLFPFHFLKCGLHNYYALLPCYAQQSLYEV
jgi:hypothetical protein